MKKQIILIARDEKTEGIIGDYLLQKGYGVISIHRKDIIKKQQIVISERFIRYCDIDLLKSNTVAAIILDSGYMWPSPVLKPTLKEWERYRNNLDEYLRNEREASSLWYSLLEILNEALPICINPQEAFEAEAFKPWAFDILANAGVSMPPAITGNDYEKIREFIRKNGGHILRLPFVESEKYGWLEDDEIEDILRRHVPVSLQSLSTRQEVTAIGVNGKPVYLNPEPEDLSAITDQTSRIQSTLNMPFARLVFRFRDNNPVLSDFSASPDIGQLPAESIKAIIDELLNLIGG